MASSIKDDPLSKNDHTNNISPLNEDPTNISFSGNSLTGNSLSTIRWRKSEDVESISDEILKSLNFREIFKAPPRIPRETLSSMNILLKAKDGETFEIKGSAALLSETITQMIDNGAAKLVVPMDDVDSETLGSVAEYLKKHSKKGKQKEEEEDIKAFDKEFMERIVKNNKWIEMVVANAHLNIEGLDRLVAEYEDQARSQ